MKSFDDMVADHIKAANKRADLHNHPPLCDKCESDQVELVTWTKSIEWECGWCGHRMYKDD